MKINFPKSERSEIKAARRIVRKEMCAKGVAKEDWDELNKRDQVYTNILKPTWVVSPDVVVESSVKILLTAAVVTLENVVMPTRSKIFSFLKL